MSLSLQKKLAKARSEAFNIRHLYTVRDLVDCNVSGDTKLDLQNRKNILLFCKLESAQRLSPFSPVNEDQRWGKKKMNLLALVENVEDFTRDVRNSKHRVLLEKEENLWAVITTRAYDSILYFLDANFDVVHNPNVKLDPNQGFIYKRTTSEEELPPLYEQKELGFVHVVVFVQGDHKPHHCSGYCDWDHDGEMVCYGMNEMQGEQISTCRYEGTFKGKRYQIELNKPR